MIELYLAIALFGVGSFLNNKKNMEPEKKEKKEKSVVANASKAKKAKASKAEKESTKCQQVVPRSFTEFLDPETKKAYEEAKNIKVPYSSQKSEETEETDKVVISPLTGSKISVSQFLEDDTGKKMLPYFGGKVTQSTSAEGFSNKLARHTGVDKDVQLKKRETKPFWKPTKDFSFVNGTPNNTDREKDRYNRSRYRTNERPTAEIRVAPGLMGKGSGINGQGGFQQFEAGDIARARFKSIDDLRVKQQITYTEPVKAGSKIAKREAVSQVAKHRPEKAFHQTLADLLKTTGQMIKFAAREQFEAPDKKKKQTREEFGHASGTVVAPRTIEITQESKRNVYENSGVRNVKMNHKWETEGETADYGKRSFVAGPNERDTTQDKVHTTNVKTTVSSITAPLLDLMKATKKENTIGNARPEGNMNPQIPNKQTVYDTNDVARTTIKETTIHNNREGNIKGPEKLTVYDPNDVAKTTIKETTEVNSHEGNIGVSTLKNQVYDYDTLPKITIRNTLDAVDYETNSTGANVPSKMETRKQDEAKKTIRETTENSDYRGTGMYNKGDGYQIDPAEAPATQKQFTSDYEYTGIAGSGRVESQRTENAERNASLNLNKQSIAKGRRPMGSNVKIWNGKEVMNVLNKRQMDGVNAERVEKSAVYQKTPSNEGKLFTNMRVNLSNDVQQDLINPEILDAFKDNPYTHSLSSYAYA
jgi:hypothetical protein